MEHVDHEWRPFDRFLRTLRLRKVRPHIVRGVKLCDLGCGQDAHLLRTFKDHISEGFGFDMLAKGFEDGNIKVSQAKLDTSIPLEEESVDTVTLLAALEHMQDDNAIAKEIHRVLRPGGSVLITVPTTYGKWLLEAMAHTRIINKAEILDHKRYYTKKDIHALLISGGFDMSNIHSEYWELGGNLFVRATKQI